MTTSTPSTTPMAEGTCARSHTVHEMARDEARHGKALKGLLDRYFKQAEK